MHKLFILSIISLTTALGFSQEPPRTLTAHGAASISKPADQLTLSIAVATEDLTAASALYQNNLKMQAVIDAMHSVKLTTSDYYTGQFNITPKYTPYPKDPPPDWAQKIVGYRVTNTITVQTDKLEQAGEIIDTVTKTGATTVEHITYSLKDDRSYQQELIKQATQHALLNAQTLAEAAHIKLGDIQQIWLDDAKPQEPRFKAFAAPMDASTPIVPGKVVLTGTVTIVFEIKNSTLEDKGKP